MKKKKKLPNIKPKTQHRKYILTITSLLIIGFLGVYINQSSFRTQVEEKIFSILNLKTDIDEHIPINEADYNELLNHALSEINLERKKHGLSNVFLSNSKCAQKHAENMLNNLYLSHWDTNGLKPYMRYSLSDGQGSMTENAAWMSSTALINPYEAIRSLNWKMIYDDADSNWGHRDNLLDPIHNQVIIGIAWNENNLFLVQDFENVYFKDIILKFMPKNESVYRLTGDIIWGNTSIEGVSIFYDPLPSNLNSSQLNNFPYNGSYEKGEFIGMILPKGWKSDEGITINAHGWDVDSDEFCIIFSLDPALELKKQGVYTIYFQGKIGNRNAILLSRSIWIRDW